MAEKVAILNLQRDHKKFIYFLDTPGNVCRKPRSPAAQSKPEIVKPAVITRDPDFLYFIDREGDVSRSRRAGSQGPVKPRQ